MTVIVIISNLCKRSETLKVSEGRDTDIQFTYFTGTGIETLEKFPDGIKET